jgi:predicted HTH transcriptional regulator
VFVEKHAVQGVEIGRLWRREHWNVPPVAVREAIVNAVVHADYAQRGRPICLAIFDDRRYLRRITVRQSRRSASGTSSR